MTQQGATASPRRPPVSRTLSWPACGMAGTRCFRGLGTLRRSRNCGVGEEECDSAACFWVLAFGTAIADVMLKVYSIDLMVRVDADPLRVW